MEKMISGTFSPPLEKVTPFRKRHNSLPLRTQNKRSRNDLITPREAELLHRIAELEKFRSTNNRHLAAVLKQTREQVTTLHTLIGYLQSELNALKTTLDSRTRK